MYIGFDRRTIQTPTTDLAAVLINGCRAEDSITPVTPNELQELKEKTDVAHLVHFQSTLPYLRHIILYSAFLHESQSTKKYKMMLHNCYFFARSILNCVTTQVAQSIPVRADDVGVIRAHCAKVADLTLKLMVKNKYYSEFDPGKPRIRSF